MKLADNLQMSLTLISNHFDPNLKEFIGEGDCNLGDHYVVRLHCRHH